MAGADLHRSHIVVERQSEMYDSSGLSLTQCIGQHDGMLMGNGTRVPKIVNREEARSIRDSTTH